MPIAAARQGGQPSPVSHNSGRYQVDRTTGKGEHPMASRPSLRDVLTNLDQPMPLREKLGKLVVNLWRRVALRQTCCGHPREPGC